MTTPEQPPLPVTNEPTVDEPVQNVGGPQTFAATETQPFEPDAYPETPPPPPIQPPVLESLAEQVQREAHEIPDSQNPTDVVPNRPQIRPAPNIEEVMVQPTPSAEETEPETEVVVDSGDPAPGGQAHAADLIAQAEAATTTEELDAIEAQAAGRVTVTNAVAERRAALGL